MSWIDEDKTVGELMEELSKYPKDAIAYAYEGEVNGVVIIQKGKRYKKLGLIETKPH